jgi:hypothetical protein
MDDPCELAATSASGLHRRRQAHASPLPRPVVRGLEEGAA